MKLTGNAARVGRVQSATARLLATMMTMPSYVTDEDVARIVEFINGEESWIRCRKTDDEAAKAAGVR